MNKRELQKAKTRRKIYQCAMELFLQQSYEMVKITDIVNRAGVSVGAFYYHFPTKADIIDEGYRQCAQLPWTRFPHFAVWFEY